jgi:polysaccharide biosynthesis protein PslH
MKILSLAPKSPFPPDDGGRVAIYQIWQALVRHGAEVHLAFPAIGGRDVVRAPVGVRVFPLKVDPRFRPLRALSSMVAGRGYFMGRFFTAEAQNELREIVMRERYDAVHVEGVYMAEYARMIKKEFGIPVVLRAQNVESDILAQYASRAGNPLVRWYVRHEAVKARAFEAEALVVFDHVLPITPQDERRLRQLSPGIRTRTVPGGVDTGSPPRSGIPEGDTVLFLTNYEWPPNRDSVTFFLKEILPFLRRLRPGVRVLVVGKGTEMLRPGNPDQDVEVCGYVENLQDVASRAAVAVIPLRIGSGMRMKLLSLMALGMAVVSTAVGAEGVEGSAGEHFVIADAPEDFAAAVGRLLGSPGESARLGRNALALVERKYSWRSVGEEVFTVYRSILGGERGSA